MSNSSLSRRKTSVQLPVPFSNDTELDEEFGTSDISMATTPKELYVADNLEISGTKSTSGPLPNVPKTYQNDQPSYCTPGETGWTDLPKLALCWPVIHILQRMPH
ncbi:Hypothetical predicted protein [Podarcis lilfordi]|uniref:Uncharacterized protein n=1 Tax=Podarcis lilfordi TaxID=74358 RepID=A0AA35K6D2_9SAUR|nr:Hypothetical predicted protein [Podarcis lilfordi]